MPQLQAASAPFLSLPFLGIQTATPSGPSSTPSRANIEHYWTCDENNPDEPVDSISADGNPRLSGFSAYTSPAGVINVCIHAAMTDIFGFTTQPNPGIGSTTTHIDGRDWTLSIWLKPDSLSGDRTIMFSRGSGGTWFANESPTDNEFQLKYDHTANRYKFSVVGPTATSAVTTTTVTASSFVPSTGVWQNIVCYYDSTNKVIGIAVNGGTPNTAAHTAGIYYAHHAQLWFGGDQTVGYDGAMDEIAIWSRVLSTSEITGLYNGGSGVALSSFTTAPNAWAEMGHKGAVCAGSALIEHDVASQDGVVCDGSAVVGVIFANQNLTGGVVVDGSSTALLRCSPALTGGTVADGSSSHTERSSNIAAGGVVADGTSSNTERYFNISTGGVVIAGLTDFGNFGVKVDGTSKNTIRARQIASGGGLLDGSAFVEAGQIGAEQGVKAGGSADVSALFHGHVTMTVDLTMAGTPFVGLLDTVTTTVNITIDAVGRTICRPAPAGGAVVDGSALVASGEAKQVSGGVVVDGSAKVGRRTLNLGREGVVADSTASQTIRAFQRGTGGVKACGKSKVSNSEPRATSGGVKAGGSAKVSGRYKVVSSGGVIAGTAAKVVYLPATQVACTVNVTINAVGRLIGRVIALGGVKVGGVSRQGLVQSKPSSGGVKAGGSAVNTVRSFQKGTGGLVANSSAKVSHRITISASGGILGNSSAPIYRVSRLTGQAGAVVGTTAKVSSREARAAGGGVQAAGEARAAALLHDSVTMQVNLRIQARPYQFILDALKEYLEENLLV